MPARPNLPPLLPKRSPPWPRLRLPFHAGVPEGRAL
jgi:hypothetical protein